MVAIFYDKVGADQELQKFFELGNKHHLQHKQKLFFAMIFGGPSDYDGHGISTLHRPLVKQLGLKPVHFDIFIGHLQSTLEEMRICEEDQTQVIHRVLKWKDCVLCRNDYA